jgi:hypothetical protein
MPGVRHPLVLDGTLSLVMPGIAASRALAVESPWGAGRHSSVPRTTSRGDGAMRRPTIISVLAIAILVSAVFRFIISFLDMAIGSYLSSMAMSPGYIEPAYRAEVDAIGDLGFWIGLFGMVVAVVMLISVRGLWTLKGWGWWLAVVVLSIALLLNLIPMIQGIMTMRLMIQTVFDTAFLAYLMTPRVRRTFSAASTDVSAPA